MVPKETLEKKETTGEAPKGLAEPKVRAGGGEAEPCHGLKTRLVPREGAQAGGMKLR